MMSDLTFCPEFIYMNNSIFLLHLMQECDSSGSCWCFMQPLFSVTVDCYVKGKTMLTLLAPIVLLVYVSFIWGFWSFLPS